MLEDDNGEGILGDATLPEALSAPEALSVPDDLNTSAYESFNGDPEEVVGTDEEDAKGAEGADCEGVGTTTKMGDGGRA